MAGLTRWEKLLVWSAVAKCGLALAAYLHAVTIGPGAISGRTHLMAAHVVTYGGVGLWLVLAGSKDQRTALWGVVLILVAEAFADPTIVGVEVSRTGGITLLARLQAVQVNAFSPYFLWRFVREFPRVAWFGVRGFTLVAFTRIAALFGVGLFVANVVGYLQLPTSELVAIDSGSAPGRLLWAFLRHNSDGAFWPLVYALAIPAAVALLLKLPLARPEESRRVRLLVAGYLLGTIPTAAWVIGASVVPDWGSLVPLSAAGWLIYPALLSPPFTTAYAVGVHKALNVRLVARTALRFAMTRYSLAIVAMLPFAALAVSVYRARNRSLTDLLSDARNLFLVVLAVSGVAAVRFRRRVLDQVDRFFFKSLYEGRQILRGLSSTARTSSDARSLVESVSNGIKQAMDPETVHVLVGSEDRGFESPMRSHRPLPPDSKIPELVGAGKDVLFVDLSHPRGLSAKLTEEDRFWLADGGVHLLMAIRAGSAEPLSGLLALGDRRDDLPFTGEDVDLLKGLVSTMAVGLGYMEVRPESDALAPPVESEPQIMEEHAGECPACGAMGPSPDAPCGTCGALLAKAPIPLVLANKFRVAERLGSGGMGVVYRALDISLGRQVAIKTLPRTTPGHASRLRAEARAVASVSHPNLALIFGGESWRGVPMLVFEYLGGGTLADRLRGGAMQESEVIALGRSLTEAVQAIHRVGILHRDIKPSNIGFTTDGMPKLLDFGLARILGGARTAPGTSVSEIHGRVFPIDQPTNTVDTLEGGDGGDVGTPLYLSPEAIDGRPPDPHSDLWALGLTLYEATAGVNPFKGKTLASTLYHIASGDLPDVREFAPDASPELARFFAAALSPDRADRPASAREMGARLASIVAAAAA